MNDDPRRGWRGFVELAKLRIVCMVLVTTAIGFLMGSGDLFSWTLLCFTLLGTGLAAAGSAALNNVVERESDGRMPRTMGRVLPSGVVEPAHALAFGILLVLGGVCVLCLFVNLLAAFLVLLTAFLYVMVYTPLKRLSWINTPIGAIPGALPPLNGWAAAADGLDPGAWVLFLILFAWQHPHFYAIAWMYREDYARADLKILSVVDPTGQRMFRQVQGFCIALLAVSLLPAIMGLTGLVYLAGSLGLGLMVLWYGMVVARTRTLHDARRLLRASIVYLPLLLILIVADLGV